MIHLPIAEISVSIYLLITLGALGGLLAGMFGVGGGFLLSPLLIFIGIPPSVAVATSANQVIASSVSGFLTHLRRRNVDIKMGLFLAGGGFIGAAFGVWLFATLKLLGQIDLVISLFYVVFLSSVGGLMGYESFCSIYYEKFPDRLPAHKKHKLKLSTRLHHMHLPLQIHFPRSNLTISALLPLLIGIIAGILVSMMGIGGGFILIPAMIYLLGVPTSIVVGTSLLQIIFITSLVTILHAITTQTVDVVLASILILGGVIGAQIGTLLSSKIPELYLRALLAAIVLLVALQLAISLFATPVSPYSIEQVRK